MDLQREIMSIRKEMSEDRLQAERTKAEIIADVGLKIENELRKSEERIANMFHLKMAEMIKLSEDHSDGKYASKTIEKWFIRFFYAIGLALLGWFTNFFHFLVELFYKAKQ